MKRAEIKARMATRAAERPAKKRNRRQLKSPQADYDTYFTSTVGEQGRRLVARKEASLRPRILLRRTPISTGDVRTRTLRHLISVDGGGNARFVCQIGQFQIPSQMLPDVSRKIIQIDGFVTAFKQILCFGERIFNNVVFRPACLSARR